ncbi:hypothetical protein Bbelb_140340 [Branchiostoma belcheri]|nr:hypothetical protein Bbelb_140340 [Branchiostoma belcheri]
MESSWTSGPLRFLIFSLALLATREPWVQAGHCWTTMSKNGKCQGLIKAFVSKEGCCRSGGVSIAYTEEDVDLGTLFKWRAFGDGAPGCEPCRGEFEEETCDDVQCGPDKRCKMNRRNKPRCVCSPDCSDPPTRGAVCGTDRKTYKTYCSLLRAKCRLSQPNLQVSYNGVCKTSCSDVTCPPGNRCVMDQNETPHCVSCEFHCPATPSLAEAVCGVDGVTYPSECHLREATCLAGHTIGVAYKGLCRGSMTCDGLACGRGKRCLVDKNNNPRCVTCGMDCSHHKAAPSDPICGSDGVTYADWCDMRETSCRTGFIIETKHIGQCTGDRMPMMTDTYLFEGSMSGEAGSSSTSFPDGDDDESR